MSVADFLPSATISPSPYGNTVKGDCFSPFFYILSFFPFFTFYFPVFVPFYVSSSLLLFHSHV